MAKMKTKKKTASHGLFWMLLKQQEGYKEAYKEVIKEGVVDHYSGGRTQSLTEMYEKYPAAYCAMIEAMKGDSYRRGLRYEAALDKDRKRVIAAICAYVDRLGYTFPTREEKIRYVIAIACRAANCSDFGSIPGSRLTAIYNLYCQRNRVAVGGNPELDYPIGIN